MMAGEHQDYGIEATDLASLLCRFEQATTSEIDVNFVSSCIQEKRQVKYRGKIIQLSRNASDNKRSSDRSILRTKRKLSDDPQPPYLHSPAKSISVKSTFFEPPCCLVESPPAAPILVKSENTAEPQISLKEKSNNFTVKTESKYMPAPEHDEICSITDTLDSFLAQSEYLFQDVISLPDFSTNTDMLDTFSSPIKNEFTDEFLEIFASDDLSTNNTLFSTVAMSDINDSHSNCSSISALLHQNSMFSNSNNNGETYLHDIADIKNGISDILLEASFNIPFDQSSLEHVTSDSQLWDIFMGLEHSYCSKLVPTTECAKDSSGCFAVFDDSQVNAVACYDQALSQCASDMSGDSCSVSSSTKADMFFIEEQEIVIDANGNDLYCHPPSQLPDCEMCDDNLSKFEGVVQTAKKDTPKKRNNSMESSLDHTVYNSEPSSEDADVFFDKIPAYYTALSISSKPVTTSIFASSTKNIGSTDHLDMWVSKEPVDDKQYDKVPPHRRCFTNTVKEVEIKPGSVDKDNVATSQEPREDVLPNSSIHESVIVPLTVENLAAADMKHPKRSHSPHSKTPGRCSRSPSRRSASTSRFSRHSASSSSDCSTCSSCSRCSTCSRSCSSSGSERGSSVCSDYRRRSRSPVSRSNKYSAETTRYGYNSLECQQSKSNALSSSEESGWRSKRHKYRSKHDSETDMKTLKKRKLKEEEQVKAMEERRIVYVGKIPDGYTKKQLYQRFQSFGTIKEVKVNFREHGDNYGFVTFAYSCDAVAAKEKGNSMPGEAKFDLCFGGRRHFCPDQYADLDGNREIEEEYASIPGNVSQGLDYAALLKLHSSQQKKK